MISLRRSRSHVVSGLQSMKSEYYLHSCCVVLCLFVSISRYYYQYEESRLDFCVLPIHGLLHIADDIRTLGPMSGTWTFYLERYCGILKREVKSRSSPWRNMDERLLHFTRLSQLRAMFDLDDELPSMRRAKTWVSTHEATRDDCEFYQYPHL